MTATKLTREEKAQALAPLKAVVAEAWAAQKAVEKSRAALERGLRNAESWEVRDNWGAGALVAYRKELLHFDFLMAERDRLVNELTAMGVKPNRFDRGFFLSLESR